MNGPIAFIRIMTGNVIFRFTRHVTLHMVGPCVLHLSELTHDDPLCVLFFNTCKCRNGILNIPAYWIYELCFQKAVTKS